MKKLICMVLLFSMCPVSFAYEGEILFRGISWDTDVVEYQKTLEQQLPIDMTDVRENMFLIYHDPNGAEYDGHSDNPDIAFYRFWFSVEKNTFIGGYPLLSISGYAMPKLSTGNTFDNSMDRSRVINSRYTFDEAELGNIEDAFHDLSDKLVSIYGPYEIEYGTDTSDSFIWYGANHTYVEAIWYHNYSEDPESYAYGENLSIEYGITNAAELVEELQNTLPKPDLSSIDGL